ncbi:MAG: sugar transferase [Akkermansiaceae bacterium]
MQGSRQRELFSIQALQLVDAVLVYLSFQLASYTRPLIRPIFGMTDVGVMSVNEITWLLFIVVPFTPAILEMFGYYNNIMRKTASMAIAQMFKCFIVLSVCIAVAIVFFQLSPSSRLQIMAAIIFMVSFLLLRDWSVRSYLKKNAKETGNKERVLLAGTSEDITDLLNTMPQEVTDYWHVVSHFDLSKSSDDELEALLIEHSVHRVIIAAKHTVFREISRAVELCEKQGIEAWVSAGFIRTQVSRPTFDHLGGKPMLVLRATPELSWTLMAKKIIDRVVAFLIIFVTWPLWLFAIIGIKIASPGASVFFKQDRAGKYGKTFKMWKFRTMVVDAEGKLAKVKAEMGNEMSGPVFKLENDPRVFPFARFLRKWSIDELPQLINVLNGDMSLVGPRPLPVYEVKEFEKSEHRRRLSVHPGITCTWQVGGRNTITEWEDWVKMDLEYIDNWSLWLDIKLLIMTVPAVLLGKGAK